MFSIGFISYTVSVIKTALEPAPEQQQELTENNLMNDAAPVAGLELVKPDEMRYAEIVNQTTNKAIQDLINKEIPAAAAATENMSSQTVSVPVNEEKSINADAKPSAPKDENTVIAQNNLIVENSKTIADKIIKKEPIVEYEDVLITDYYLRHYYGEEDYIDLRQRLSSVDKDLESDNDSKLRQKYKESLLKDKQSVLREQEIRDNAIRGEENRRRRTEQ